MTSQKPHEDPSPIDELHGARALVVDDNEVNQRVLHAQLTNWGLRSAALDSGEAALSALRAAVADGDPYQFAILDYHMPNMDGATLAGLIQSDPVINDVAILMLTSIGHSGEVRQADRLRLDAYLLKPVRESQLLRTLTTTLSRRSAAKAQERGLGPKEEATNPDPGAPLPETRVGLGAPAHAVRVLLVEDNIVNQKVASRMIERLGMRADVANNGREAVEMFEQERYDLVFMDCQMPVMDGFDASRKIRQAETAGRRTPIIAMTAEAMTGARESCLNAGMDDYIAKPVKLDDLTRAVDKWVGERQLLGLQPHDAAG